MILVASKRNDGPSKPTTKVRETPTLKRTTTWNGFWKL
jgi:hypothetical protein